MWLMEGVTKEVRDVSTTPRGQQPARPVSSFETARDFTSAQSSDGGADRRGGLDGDGIAGREGSRQEAQERGGTPAQLARDARSADVDGDSKDALPRGGGANPVLRTGADRDGLDAGLHDDSGFRAASRRRRMQADQRGGGETGRGAGACRLKGGSRRQDRKSVV